MFWRLWVLSAATDGRCLACLLGAAVAFLICFGVGYLRCLIAASSRSLQVIAAILYVAQ
jgi:hypothetical protein